MSKHFDSLESLGTEACRALGASWWEAVCRQALTPIEEKKGLGREDMSSHSLAIATSINETDFRHFD